MSLLTNIAGVPLYSTIQEALAWAKVNGLYGYHLHTWRSLQGYMGGVNHLQATKPSTNLTAPTQQNQQPTITIPTVIIPTVTRPTVTTPIITAPSIDLTTPGGGGGGGY